MVNPRIKIATLQSVLSALLINGADNVADELRRIGNNVNQIARAVNSGYATEVNLTETREELKAIWQSLNSLLRTAR